MLTRRVGLHTVNKLIQVIHEILPLFLPNEMHESEEKNNLDVTQLPLSAINCTHVVMSMHIYHFWFDKLRFQARFYFPIIRFVRILSIQLKGSVWI